MRTEINEIKNQKTIQKINKIESWIFEKTNKIWHTSSKTDNTERRYKLPILGMKIEITPQALQTWKGSPREHLYYKQLYIHTFDNLDEIDHFFWKTWNTTIYPIWNK